MKGSANKTWWRAVKLQQQRRRAKHGRWRIGFGGIKWLVYCRGGFNVITPAGSSDCSRLSLRGIVCASHGVEALL